MILTNGDLYNRKRMWGNHHYTLSTPPCVMTGCRPLLLLHHAQWHSIFYWAGFTAAHWLTPAVFKMCCRHKEIKLTWLETHTHTHSPTHPLPHSSIHSLTHTFLKCLIDKLFQLNGLCISRFILEQDANILQSFLIILRKTEKETTDKKMFKKPLVYPLFIIITRHSESAAVIQPVHW